MKVAFFVHRFPVVSEVFVANAALGLVRAGHEVDVYALSGAGDEPCAASAVFNQHEGKVAQHAFNLRERPRRRVALAPLAFAKLAARHGTKSARALSSRSFGEQTQSLIPLHEASMFRRRGRYDVLHCQFGTLAEAVLNHRDAGFLSGRVFVHFRGFDISGHVAAFGDQAYSGVFARADGFLTNCGFFYRRLLELGAPAGRTTIIPSAVDLDGFSYTARSWAPGQTLRLLCVGRLVEKKGFAYAVDALARLASRGVDFKCGIIGDGPLRGALEAQVAALSLQDRVTFMGSADHERIAAALGDAHIFLAPSLRAANGDEDAAINTLKEAMASGCPFVASDHGGIPELAAGADAGVIVPEADAEAIENGVLKLLGASPAWPAMGVRGRARVARDYSIDVATAKTLAAYRRALAPPHGIERGT